MNKGTNAGWVVPPLLSCLNDTALAPYAIEALGNLKLEPVLVAPVLAQCLRETNTSLGATAAEALGKFGTSASNAGPDLVKALTSKDPLVRQAATNALIKIAPEALRYPVSGGR